MRSLHSFPFFHILHVNFQLFFPLLFFSQFLSYITVFLKLNRVLAITGQILVKPMKWFFLEISVYRTDGAAGSLHGIRHEIS